jgi:hypothetical protein
MLTPVVIETERGQPRYISDREHALAQQLHAVNRELAEARREAKQLRMRVRALEEANEGLRATQIARPVSQLPAAPEEPSVQRIGPSNLELVLNRVREGLPLLAAGTAIKEWDKLPLGDQRRFEECLKRLGVKDGRLLRFMKKALRGNGGCADIDRKYGQKPGTLWSVRASQKLRVFFVPLSGGGYIVHGFASRGDSVFRHE